MGKLKPDLSGKGNGLMYPHNVRGCIANCRMVIVLGLAKVERGYHPFSPSRTHFCQAINHLHTQHLVRHRPCLPSLRDRCQTGGEKAVGDESGILWLFLRATCAWVMWL